MRKDKFKVPFRVVVTLCAALGWWGVLYPELTMTPDTYKIVTEDAVIMEELGETEWRFDNEIYEKILKTDCSRIRFRSRLLMNLNAL